MAKEKSLGRTKAKENAFINMGSRPEEYRPITTKIFHKTANCELCGQHIGYDFLLEHKSNPDKNLHVGSDCIISFCETYLPNMVATMLRKMEMEMHALVEQEKAKVFAEKYPNFKTDHELLTKGVNELLKRHDLQTDFRGMKRLPVYESLEETRKEWNNKKYTTGPKIEAFYIEVKRLNSGDMEADFINHKQMKASGITIGEDRKKSPANEEFYDKYFALANYNDWINFREKRKPSESDPALSSVDKDTFLVLSQDYENKRIRTKKKIKKDRDSIIEKLRSQVSDRLKVEMVEKDRAPFSYVYNDADKAAVEQYKAYVDTSSMYYGVKVRNEIVEYGLKSVGEIFGKREEDMATMGKAENYHIFNRSVFMFRDEASANEFLENIRDVVELKIKEIDEFLASSEVTTEKFN